MVRRASRSVTWIRERESQWEHLRSWNCQVHVADPSYWSFPPSVCEAVRVGSPAALTDTLAALAE